MRFHPSDAQAAIQDSLRRTLADVLPDERRRALMDGDADFDPPSWEALMALGLGGLAVPEAFGGSELGLLDLAFAAEVLGEAAAPGPLIPHLMAGIAIAACADADLKAQILPGIASGATVATMALGGAWVPESWDVVLDGGTVTGTVRFVPGARTASLFVVGVAGGGFVLAEAGEGVMVTKHQSTDRTRQTALVDFEAAPAITLLPPGDPDAMRVFDAGLILQAADALGGAQYCLDRSVAYALEREQFGRKIGGFQALKHQLAGMALEVEPARALLWYAAYAFDAGLPDRRRTAALAFAHLADRFVSVTRAAIAVHGGIGYTWDYGLHVWFRRAVFDRAYLGAPSLHRARAASLAGW